MKVLACFHFYLEELPLYLPLIQHGNHSCENTWSNHFHPPINWISLATYKYSVTLLDSQILRMWI